MWPFLCLKLGVQGSSYAQNRVPSVGLNTAPKRLKFFLAPNWVKTNGKIHSANLKSNYFTFWTPLIYIDGVIRIEIIMDHIRPGHNG